MSHDPLGDSDELGSRPCSPTDFNASSVDTEDWDYPNGMTRREWMKYFGAGGLAAGLSSIAGCTGSTSGGGGDSGGSAEENSLNFPLDQPDKFSDITLRWTTDSSAGPVFSMFGHIMNEETGVSFDDGKVLPASNYYSKLNSELIGGGDVPYDITLLVPLYLGDFQARGLFEPLDDYIAQYKGLDEYLDTIIEPYKEFYMKYDGNIVGIPIDGDIHNLFYRPSFFSDEKHQEQYKEEYGQELRVPQTWPEYNQVAKYFTENTEDGTYGTMVFGGRPWNFGWFMDRAASRGVIYFDEEMNPQINSDEAVEALEHMVETAKYAPEGTEQFGIQETINQWQQGNVVMAPWWIDLTEFTARGDFPVVGDQSAAKMPGWEQDDGSIRRNAMMLYNRLYTIPKSLDSKRKQAAFYAITRLSEKDVSVYTVSDPYTGLDPNLEAHYTEKAAEQYTKANPKRGTGEGFPKNPPIFAPDKEYPEGRSAKEQALQHIKAGESNMKNGFPQPNWPGASQYIESLSIHIQRAIAGQETPQEALDKVAEKWTETVDELGRENQKEAYQQFIEKAKKFDYI